MWTPGRQLTSNPNLLRNGDFGLQQRGAGPFTSATPFVNNDDSYLLDGWIYLADGADICDVSRTVTDIPQGAKAACVLDVETGDKKFGILQVVENVDALAIIGGVASLSFMAKITGTSIANIRAAVLSWVSTVNVVTSDLVSAWGAAGTLPTLVASWLLEGDTGLLVPTTSWQRFLLPNIAINEAGANNVGVFIWVDDTTLTVGDLLTLTDIKLEAGPICTPYDHGVPISEETARAHRYFWKNHVGAPHQGSVAAPYVVSSASIADAEFYIHIPLPVPMRTTPVVQTFPYTTSTNTGRSSNGLGTDFAANSAVAAAPNALQIAIQNSSGGALTVTANRLIMCGVYASAEL